MKLFVYGVLKDEVLTEALLGHPVNMQPAVIEGYRRSCFQHPDYEAYAMAVKDDDASIEGILIDNLSAADLALLDRFEETDMKMYERIEVSLAGEPVYLYIAGAFSEGYVSGEWPEEAFMARFRESYLREWIPDFRDSQAT